MQGTKSKRKVKRLNKKKTEKQKKIKIKKTENKSQRKRNTALSSCERKARDGSFWKPGMPHELEQTFVPKSGMQTQAMWRLLET